MEFIPLIILFHFSKTKKKSENFIKQVFFQKTKKGIHHITACIWLRLSPYFRKSPPKFRKKQLDFKKNFCETSDILKRYMK
jgi:hypothetical protein